MSITLATDLWRMGATELAEAITTRQTSCREVVQAHLERIDGVNRSINALVVVMAEQALEAAKMADRAVTAGADLGRFHGVLYRHPNHAGVQGASERLSASRCSGR